MPPAERMQAGELRVSVRYRLGEYVAFAVAHALDTDAFVRAAPVWKQRMFAMLLALVACITFVVKSLRVGRCDFVIDDNGIERRSRRGTSGLPWSRVQAVHVYPCGYLVELESGAVPLPFRVLTQRTRQKFEQLAGPLLRSGQH